MKSSLHLTLAGLTLTSTAFAGGGADCATPVPLPMSGAQIVAIDTTGAAVSADFNSCHGASAGAANSGFPSAEYYEFVPDASGVWFFTTCNTAAYDTLLGLYNVGCGTELACNDDGPGSCAGFTSEMTAGPLVSGTTYLLQVGGFGDATGTGTLDISLLGAAPGNDDCANATVLPNGASSTAWSNTNSTPDGATPACGVAFSNANNVWYDWTPGTAGDWVISTSASTIPTRIAVYSGCGGAELTCNSPGGEASATLFGAGAATNYRIMIAGGGTETGLGTLDIALAPPPTPGEACVTALGLAVPSNTFFDTTGSTSEGDVISCNGNVANDIWYSFTTAPAGGTHVITTCGSGYDTRIALWDACGGTELACNDDDCGLQSTITACGLSGSTTYLLQIGGFGLATGTGILDLSVSAAVPPANDSCAGATAMTDGATSIAVDTTGACNNGPQPSCASVFDTPNDTFYSWSPDADGFWEFTTTGSAFDTRITVFSACGGTELGCAAGFPDAALQIAGLLDASTYIIMMSGDGSLTGTTTLNTSVFNPPPGDDCATAIALPDGAQTVMTDTTGATSTGALNGCGGPDVEIFYEWSPDADGEWTFSNCNFSGYDSRLALYSACGGTEIACNDDGVNCPGLESEMIVPGLLASDTYYLMVGGFGLGTGTSNLDVTQTGLPVQPGTDYCPLTVNSAGAGADMTATGSASVAADDLVLVCEDCPLGQPGVFFYGPSQIMVPFGEGNRCVGGAVIRLWPPLLIDATTGVATRPVGNSVSPSAGVIVDGASLNFQFWFRDPAGGGSGFNLSNGYNIVFTP